MVTRAKPRLSGITSAYLRKSNPPGRLCTQLFKNQNTVYIYSMPAIRFRPNNVCSATVGDIPGGKAFLKTVPTAPGQSPSASPVDWLGFICKTGARRLRFARAGKMEATAITNGDAVADIWRSLSRDEYVVCMIVQISDHKFGAFAVVERDGWPLVRSDTKPLLTVVQAPAKRKVVSLK